MRITKKICSLYLKAMRVQKRSRTAFAKGRGHFYRWFDHMREGRVADGFVEAIERCGVVLATHFPARPDERSELPDRIYLI